MKTLIVGGAGHGKSVYVRERYAPADVRDGNTCAFEDAFGGDALIGLHMLSLRLMREGIDPVGFVISALDKRTDWLIVCNEIGCGIVPVDKFDRDWRENVGRICRELANRAQVVERVCCGLPQRLK